MRVIDVRSFDIPSEENDYDELVAFADTIANAHEFEAVPIEVIDKIRAEITNCLKALDEIEKSGFNIYLPNEISARRLTYQQCLGFIDKHKAESEDK